MKIKYRYQIWVPFLQRRIVNVYFPSISTLKLLMFYYFARKVSYEIGLKMGICLSVKIIQQHNVQDIEEGGACQKQKKMENMKELQEDAYRICKFRDIG
ncbi:unnamed protein product [Paramecium octaurelia]|uniref:Uncharacterized protein n=1 Tax=Paramecium octaurelia TaxID=43137 RepID=A0A8S1V758_PAROT|nr:unnamed protein product [Paramecium octaurelia]